MYVERHAIAITTDASGDFSGFTPVVRRQATHGVDGSASLYAAAGEPVEAPVVVAYERLNVVIAEGGNAKLGTLHVWVE